MASASINFAQILDAALINDRDGLVLPPAKAIFTSLRARLYVYGQNQNHRNNVYALISTSNPNGDTHVIELGPSFDKGPEPSHFYFDSGARLSFGITLRENRQSSQLLGYRFHFQSSGGTSPSFIRMDLNKNVHATPLQEPICHLHPGSDQVRIACPIMDPRHVLEVLLSAVAPHL